MHVMHQKCVSVTKRNVSNALKLPMTNNYFVLYLTHFLTYFFSIIYLFSILDTKQNNELKTPHRLHHV